MKMEDFSPSLNLLIEKSEKNDLTFSLFQKIVTNKLIKKILQEILASEECLKSITRSSYIHSNGFIKIVLGTNKNKESFRLHYWNQSNELAKRDIHNHSWDFYSSILFGQLRVHLYEECKEDYEYIYEKYLIGNLSNKVVIPKGKVMLSTIQVLDLYYPTKYFSKSRIIHDLFAVQPSATFIFQKKHTSNSSSVFSNMDITTTKKPYDVERLDLNKIKRILTRILDKI